MNPLIYIFNHEDGAQVKPAQYLDGSFNIYRDACVRSGAKYDMNKRINTLHLEMVPVLAENLRLAGFDVQIALELQEAVIAQSLNAQKSVQAATDRMAKMDTDLQRRGLRMFEFQKSGVKWLSERTNALLADEMGLGKTVQALLAIPVGVPTIVVSPASLKGNWRNEAKKWRPDLTVEVLSGRTSWRWPRPGEIIILNYDILPEKPKMDVSLETQIGELWKKSMPSMENVVLIADEAHALKNAKSLRTGKFKEISEIVQERGGKVWLLTGTPLLNRPSELWNILNIANLGDKAFGSFWGFVKMFGGVKTSEGIEWGDPRPEVPAILRNVMLQRLRAKVLPDLPAKIWRNIEVDLDTQTREDCDHVLGIFEEKGIPFSAVNEDNFKSFTKIAFEEIAKIRAELAQAKIAAMLELVETYEDQQQPVVVFSAHKSPINALANRKGWAIITGDTPNEMRSQIVDAFQGGRLRGMGATIQAGGVGLTLTRANECIFVDLMWTPALNKQAEDRICRIGQTRGVVVNRLMADHELERRVMEVLHEKQMLIENSVEKAAVGNEFNQEMEQKYERPVLTTVSEKISSPD